MTSTVRRRAAGRHRPLSSEGAASNPLLAIIAPLRGANGGKKVRFPIPKHDQDMVRQFRDLMASGELRPVIDRTYSLDQIAEAYRYVETGRKTGNVVISVEPSR